MIVKRIVPNIATPRTEEASAFYSDIFGLSPVMDHGWIVTFAGDALTSRPQLSIAAEGGSGTPVPDISIEVDNLEEILRRVRARDLPIEYGPALEPWGVRRFYLRDPFGTLLNVLEHSARSP